MIVAILKEQGEKSQAYTMRINADHSLSFHGWQHTDLLTIDFHI